MGCLDNRVSGETQSPTAYLDCGHLEHELNESIIGSDSDIKDNHMLSCSTS